MTDRPLSFGTLQELFTNHELLFREAHRPTEPGPEGVRRVAIVGGGTAGWLTALALRAQLPWVEVTLLEAPSIPIIGVGEASVPSLVSFLHHYLDLDVLELTREVRPTWKQGIRFEWGQPGDYVFQAPFDWEVNGVGMLGSVAELGNVSAYTLQAQLMERGVTSILRDGKRLEPLLPVLAHAYHLDNQRFVAYLTKVALERGVVRREVELAGAETASVPGDPDPHVTRLVARDGTALSFDLYVDCSGFRSFLLEHTLGVPFHSFAGSLFTDRALAYDAPHGGDPKPYTTARTMESGWRWTIPVVEADHHGYVYSSAFASDDEAHAEAARLHPGLAELGHARVVRFRSGRHDRAWVGNVFALGNAYAFVEPLESTGLLMITRAITSLVRSFPVGPHSRPVRRFVNAALGRDWDRLRWFLAAHFKFNQKLDTPFWREARARVDVSGLASALELYEACGPLSLLPRAIRTSLADEVGVFFYGLHGLDTILLGQQVPHRALAREPSPAWKKRNALAASIASRGVPQIEALRAVGEHPEWLVQMVGHPSGWVAKMAPYL